MSFLIGDSLKASNGSMFSTYDSDNDASHGNCANGWKGGWWFFRYEPKCRLNNSKKISLRM